MTWTFASISDMLKDDVNYGYNIYKTLIEFSFVAFRRRDAIDPGVNGPYKCKRSSEKIHLVHITTTFIYQKEMKVSLKGGGKAV